MRVRALVVVATMFLGASLAGYGCAPAIPSPEPTQTPTAVTTSVRAGPTDIAVDRMEQVLTGTVERIGLCTVLIVGDRRLPLVDADAVLPGSRVTVRGSPVSVPSPCSGVGVGQALRVTTVRPA